ncbi:DUF2500 domain-containing protein [Paenibacillus tuaregi]|uniref:DUF2500 domain-containing protein n=1 Tax=Paenibacillus tuaregi TaxID=1816681 RepID=UPI0008382E97|nr:DUF2500 domain-containing protein [Paenibacillus tuaregi]
MDRFDGFGGPEAFFEFLIGVPMWVKVAGVILLVVVIAIFAYAIIKGLMVWSANNKNRLLMKYAVVSSKRTEMHGTGSGPYTPRYFITFELEDGRKLEFRMAAREYAILKEKDEGEITYQGGVFKNFNRRIKGEYKQHG